jgi:hypothetical protein
VSDQEPEPEPGDIPVLDLTSAEIPSMSVGAELITVTPAEQFERQIRGRQEWVRTALAVGAFLSLVAVLIIFLFSVASELSPENLETVAVVVVTPLTGIVGTIVGFYFAERRGQT